MCITYETSEVKVITDLWEEAACETHGESLPVWVRIKVQTEICGVG